MNKKMSIMLMIGAIMYLIGFVWVSKLGSIIFLIGGLILSGTVFIYGRKVKKTKKVLSILCLIFSLFIMLTIILLGLFMVFTKF